MFQVYLPIAEISVNLVVMLGLGAAVGFLSGMFGVGGGFMLTPFLILSGIPASIAVATGANQIVATSVSGALAQWRRNNIDFRMGAVLIVGGVAGALVGVLLLKLLREAGQAGLIVSLTYVALLGAVGILMLAESIRAIRRTRAGKPASAASPGQHIWIHKLPFKLRFPRSRLYISAIPPLVDRLGGRPARRVSRRRRRVHHGAGDDLPVAHADQYRDRHLDLSDHFRYRRRRPCCTRASPTRSMWCLR